MTLDFETNDMLDHAHQEIMDMHFQDVFDIEWKRIELKVKLNYLDENDCDIIDYRH